MSASSSFSRTAWQDRWNRPTTVRLLDDLQAHHRKLFDHMIEQLQQFDGVDANVTWYGTAWKWTIRFALHDRRGRELDDVVYLVPNVESPLICVPMTTAFVDQLPLRKLARTVRDGVKSAKCAVAIHWGVWSPNTVSEVNDLADLVRRKIDYRQAQPTAAAG
jgi:hypothetical protein